MAETNDHADMNKMLFSNLVMMLSTSVMQQLGKLVNPVTRKTELDLEGAQISIDVLSMLQEKTRGNLDKEEERLLANILSTLQMNYVETAQSAPPPKKEEKPDDKAAAKPEETAPKAEEAKDSAEKKDPKFRKSYGA